MEARVSAYLHPSTDVKCRITNVDLRESGVGIIWSDSHRSFFHYVWLRDCCYCESCGDSYSSKRYFVPNEMPDHPSAIHAEIGKDGGLSITWKSDGHRSVYDPAWLRQHCYDDHARDERKIRPVLWDAERMNELPRFDLGHVSENDSVLLEMFRGLRDFGLVIIHGASPEPGFIRGVAELVGGLGSGSSYGDIFDLTPSSSVRTMGNTFRAVPPHTDEAFRHAPPGLNILGCVRPAEQAGESIFVDGFQVARILRETDSDAFRLLSTLSHSYHRCHDATIDQHTRSSIIALDDEGEVIGIRLHTRSSGPLDLPMEMMPAYYAAYQRICEIVMERSSQICFVMQPGEAAIFDNHRVLHARGSFTDPSRFMQLCNVSREDFHERLRLLARQLGQTAEARQILGGGVTA